MQGEVIILISARSLAIPRQERELSPNVEREIGRGRRGRRLPTIV